MNTQRPFTTSPWEIIPADSRQVTNPIENTPYKLVSDLIPVAAITEDWPIKGVTTYGECEYVNAAEPNPFAAYVFAQLGESYGLYVRAYFVKVISETDKLVPAYERSKIGDYPWPPILEWYQFEQDVTTPITATYADSSGRKGTSIVPRFRVKLGWVDSVDQGTTIIYRHFVASTPWLLKNAQVNPPQSTHIAWSLPGTVETLPKCLHGDVEIPGLPTRMRVVYPDNTTSIVPTTASGKGSMYPKTNHRTWLEHVAEEDFKDYIGYYERIQTIVIPPIKPKASVQIL